MKKKIWIWLLIPVLLLVSAYLVLFQINHFAVVIQPKGEAEITISVGEPYVEQGVEMKLVGSLFLKDGIVLQESVARTGTVDTSVPGTYELEYRATNPKINCCGKRIVRVVDVEAPRITLFSIPGTYTVYGEPYADEGYQAWDAVDGDITDRVIREEHDGFVTYQVSDKAGNTVSVGRKILYLDLTAPALVLRGESVEYVTAGAEFAEPGWNALDGIDGDLSERVKVEGFVDKYLAGDYQLHYTVTDESGNCAEAYRTVTVRAKQQPEKVTPTGKVIYLTFDDGPGPYTEQLLRVLKKYDAKATFFVVNTDYIGLVEDMVADGHSVGIHSVNHDYREIYASADAYFNDILTMQQIIYEYCGVETYLMRFPGGSSNTVSRFNRGIMTYLTQAVEDMGFQYFDWNVDSNDAGGANDAQEVFDNVVAGAEVRRISVVLQHDIKWFSVDAVERILKWGIANGYQFLGLDMSSPTSHHGVNN